MCVCVCVCVCGVESDQVQQPPPKKFKSTTIFTTSTSNRKFHSDNSNIPHYESSQAIILFHTVLCYMKCPVPKGQKLFN